MENKRNTLQKLLVTSAIGYALHVTWPHVSSGHAPEWQVYTFAGGVILAAIGAIGVASDVVAVAQKAARIFRAHRPKRSEASARWLTRREARKAGMAKTKGVFLGIAEGQPLFLENGVHGLICAPARKGKTTSFVMPALCHDIGASRIVTDMKGELAVQTMVLIAERQGQEVIALNPAHKFGLPSSAYNPVQIILDDLKFAPEDTFPDTWSLAKQLHPSAPGGDRDPFWPNGTRKLLVFVIVVLVVLRGEEEANLPRAFEVLGQTAEFDQLLEEALSNDALAGELAALASNIASTREENPKHFESFREGAIQSLTAFGPSGRLAPSMTHCSFRFRDLKTKNITLFLVCDYSRMDAFAPWLGVLIWAALKELIREDNAIPVYFLLDEFTNYVLPGLPNALTALGGYGVRCWMVAQELQEIARVYGREALATILSQADVKQFFGVSSLETASLVSRMLGNKEQTSESFGLGKEFFEMPSLSLGLGAKPLMTPDQLRRLPEDEQIIFVRNLPPIRALKVGYQEVAPWRNEVAPNPLHGGKRFVGRLRMRIRGGKARATRAGRRKIAREKRPLIRPLVHALYGIVPAAPVIFLTAGIAVVLLFGWPQVRVEYTVTYSWCRYAALPFVAKPVTLIGAGQCPLILWTKAGGTQ